MTAERILRAAPLMLLAEQAAFALTGLATQLLLARAVTPATFGAYSVASTFFLIAAIAHQTCVIEPMLVFSAGRLRDALPRYHRLLLGRWSIRFSLGLVAAGLAPAAFALARGAAPVAAALLAFALAAPPILYLWLLRRIAFALGRPGLSLAATLIHAAATLGLLGAARALGGLGPAAAILGPALAAVAASAFLARRLSWPPGSATPPADLRARHLAYGRWALGAEAVNWALTNGPLLVPPLWLGLAAAAQLRMLALVFMPLSQASAVASLLLLRRFARTGGGDAMTTITALLGFAGGGAAYTLATVAAWTKAEPHLLGPDYRIEPLLLAIAGCGATCLVAAQAFIVNLRARERTGAVLAASLVALATLAALLPAALPHGVAGVLTAQAAAWGAALLAAGLLATLPAVSARARHFPGETGTTEPEAAP
ncbi:hypothetical protein [Amaricoccus solimangrovi]|uniref:O-antigen/teichoic acid export membrane protein n=1 Tax=Amaricoccus solimangrovi TaxID=2589815 RepID=A0A501WJ29_9RHOB|nr:hypothetical protein [Amaricoccus solimangrovi]TPE49903.1 hypothetical protein FJM51_13135 [Amaricoccus solimangrovi]